MNRRLGGVSAAVRRLGVSVLALSAVAALVGCEAPLMLDKVKREQSASIHPFDQFKSVASSDSRVVVVSDAGVLLVSDHAARDWHRLQLPTKASFLNVTACPNGRFAAIDTRRTLWVSDEAGERWDAKPVDTPESLMALACDANDAIWVGASFSTLLTSPDLGESWSSTTQDEDLQFTAIQFVDDRFVVAAGEFGTLMFSDDGGQNWDRAEPIPNEFYPMGLYFADRDRGWVSGLGGTIYYTGDRGRTWQRQDSTSSAPLYGFAAAGERLFVFGDNGTLLALHGERWQAVPELPDIAAYLIGGTALDGQRLLVAGGAGTLETIDLSGGDALLAGQEPKP
jgi:photosystem II stability/assembly factor-like uncharacterized protein